jgi:nitronate monooxygenase
MPFHTHLTRRLGLEHPIIQAPMAGGATTVDLVAAVGEAGAIGFFGAAYDTPERIAEITGELRRRSARPFGINLFAPLPTPEEADPAPMLEIVARYHAELGLPPPAPPTPPEDRFPEQLQAALDSGAAALSFTFGKPPAEAVAGARQRGLLLVGTATSEAEALELESLGVDAVVAQGSEAGAHRGTFAGPFEDAMIGTLALASQGNPGMLSLWAGQGVRLARQEPAASLVARLADELQAAVERLAATGPAANRTS